MKVIVIDGVRVLREHFLQGKNIHVKYVRCGRENCRCRLGERHGPYYYRREKTQGGYKDHYIKPPKHCLSLKYEEVTSALLLEIDEIENMPDFLKQCPTFLVKERIT